MNISPKVRLILYVLVLFYFTFSATSNIISGFKTSEYNFLRIAIAIFGIIFSIMNIVKIGKEINNKEQ